MESRMKERFEALGMRWSRTRERGATAVVVALCLLLLMAAAAMSFDTANLALQRQVLQNITDAAAQAGATYLPGDPAGAIAAVNEYAHRYDTNLNLTVKLLCIVPSTGSTKQVAPGNIPAMCDPGPYTTYVCDTVFCDIPCPPSTGAMCNAVKVDGKKDVPFYFAPAIGIPSGKTGAVTSVSCIRSCGGTVNPMDVAFIVDRTASLDPTVYASMQQGIKDALATMTPEYQFVTLGAIHKSTTDSKGCKTNLAAYSKTTTANGDARLGNWMPLDFSNNYLNGTLTSTSRSLNTTSALYQGLGCMNQASQPWGTHLAAPLKAAARMLLGNTGNLGTLDYARQSILPPDALPVTKAIIMETDGVPEETIGYNGTVGSTTYKDTNKSLGNTSLTADATDPTSGDPAKGEDGCNNLKAVAKNAKDAGILLIMIGYGQATTGAHCNRDGSGTMYVDDVLAAAATPRGGNPLTPSVSPSTCAIANTDGDNYFCAANGADLGKIFRTAVDQAKTSKTRFVKPVPGS